MLKIEHSHDGETWHHNAAADDVLAAMVSRDNLTSWQGFVDQLRQNVSKRPDRPMLFYRLIDENETRTFVVH